MTNEQREAIERLKDDIKHAELRDAVDDDCTVCFTEDVDTVLSLIKEQQEQIEKKDKYIDFYKKGLEREIESNRENIMELIKQDKEIKKIKDKEVLVKRYFKKCDLIKQKDKQIDLMAKKINQAYFDEDKFCVWFEKMMGVQQKMDYGYVVDLIKQYFERKVNSSEQNRTVEKE